MLKQQIVNCEDAQELITGLVDGELSTEDFESITNHFQGCNECSDAYSRELALKRLLKESVVLMHAPRTLRLNVSTQVRRRRRQAWLATHWQMPPRAGALAYHTTIVLALLAFPVLIARFWRTSLNTPIVPGIFQSYRQIDGSEIAFAKIGDITELKEQLAVSVGRQFAPMAYDFSTMNIHLVGGLNQVIANRKVLVAVYRGNDSMILCYTFVGSEDDAPPTAEVILDAERRMNFYQFAYTQTNAVMHREGNIICVLMSRIPKADLLALARAKAHSS
jgi:anti-sigma factor (TIGR02949 family)